MLLFQCHGLQLQPCQFVSIFSTGILIVDIAKSEPLQANRCSPSGWEDAGVLKKMPCPYNPCMLCYLNLIMLPTFGLILMVNVGKYTTFHWVRKIFTPVEKSSPWSCRPAAVNKTSDRISAGKLPRSWCHACQFGWHE